MHKNDSCALQQHNRTLICISEFYSIKDVVISFLKLATCIWISTSQLYRRANRPYDHCSRMSGPLPSLDTHNLRNAGTDPLERQMELLGLIASWTLWVQFFIDLKYVDDYKKLFRTPIPDAFFLIHSLGTLLWLRTDGQRQTYTIVC